MEYAPIFIFALIGGTFADRWKPKKTMVWCELLSAVSVLLVMLALLSGAWYALLLGTFISASLSQFSQPSAMKLFKLHVPEEQLQGVMAMNQSLTALFMIFGPIVGAFVFQQFGIEVSLGITLVMFLLSALVLSSLPRDKEEPKPDVPQNFIKEMAAGIRYIWVTPSLRTLSTTFAVTGLGAGLIQPLALFICIENLGLDKVFLQWFLMAGGIAMLVGGMAGMGLAKKISPQTMLALGLLISAFSTVGVGASTSVPLTFLLQIISSFFYPCIHIGIQTLIMKKTQTEYIGRVGGAITPILMGMMVIGMSLSGILKDMLSLFIVYGISAALLLIGTILLAPLFKKDQQLQQLPQ
ncbi:enterobactin exporter EntS [compost metagenome]